MNYNCPQEQKIAAKHALKCYNMLHKLYPAFFVDVHPRHWLLVTCFHNIFTSILNRITQRDFNSSSFYHSYIQCKLKALHWEAVDFSFGSVMSIPTTIAHVLLIHVLGRHKSTTHTHTLPLPLSLSMLDLFTFPTPSTSSCCKQTPRITQSLLTLS
jgi:hypothetical protein